AALNKGARGLRSGDSLAGLLARCRGVRNIRRPPDLTKAQVLAWADAYYRHEGRWPNMHLGAIAGSGRETWLGINHALRRGTRGLTGPTSLARLLTRARAVPHQRDRPRLTEKQILGWAEAHWQRTGAWPTQNSGPVVDAAASAGMRSGETWNA